MTHILENLAHKMVPVTYNPLGAHPPSIRMPSRSSMTLWVTWRNVLLGCHRWHKGSRYGHGERFTTSPKNINLFLRKGRRFMASNWLQWTLHDQTLKLPALGANQNPKSWSFTVDGKKTGYWAVCWRANHLHLRFMDLWVFFCMVTCCHLAAFLDTSARSKRPTCEISHAF